jgi:hypothetical protein
MEELNGNHCLPEHLRDDAPYQVCSGCGRKTWSKSEFGQICSMPQPDNIICLGMFLEELW